MKFSCFLIACGSLVAGLAWAAPPETLSAAARAKTKTSGNCRNGEAGFFRDQGLTMKLASKLQFNGTLLREKIDVRVLNGVATLSGGLSTPQHITAALNIAAEVEGISCINNFLRVGPQDAGPGSALSAG